MWTSETASVGHLATARCSRAATARSAHLIGAGTHLRACTHVPLGDAQGLVSALHDKGGFHKVSRTWAECSRAGDATQNKHWGTTTVVQLRRCARDMKWMHNCRPFTRRAASPTGAW
jgi:hypothetical protein